MNTAVLLGRPGIGTRSSISHRIVSQDGNFVWLPGGGTIDGAKSRDPGNADDTLALRAGLPMGIVTASGKYATSFFGVTAGALAGTGTTFSVPVAAAVEIVRRVGATGTLKIIGPPGAAGVVRVLTVTYSAVDVVTGALTITALGVNEVQTVNLSTAGTGGNLRLLVQKVDGTFALTPNVAWSATDATLLSNLNTALDTATGVVGGIVATAIAATDTDLGFVLTYSGTGYAGNTWALAQVDTMFTSNTGANVVRTTTGVPGAFVAGSLIADTDGSHVPRTVIPDGWGLQISQPTAGDTDFPQIPVAGILRTDMIINYPADASTKAWLRASMSAVGTGGFAFTDQF
ncbi:MAG TPA: hypothetical protein VD866_04590 [Urbifossiella sp.]|nr:hypothetical protein [Urbifossiella sp.]